MRVLWMAVVFMLLGFDAQALEIKGKWGIGAGLFGNGFETSLMRGVSDRSLWALDFQGRQVSQHLDTTLPGALDHRTDWLVQAGPRYRRFFRPASSFSPYGDLFAAGFYRSSNQTGESIEAESTTWGAELGLAFRVEYQTPWS